MVDHFVLRSIQRAPAEVVAGLEDAGVATVHEAYGRQGLLDPGIRPIQMDRAVAGSAVTVSCAPGDNMMIHAAVEVIEPGDIMVVTTTGPSTDGMFGDLLATSVIARGGVGLVIEAGVRDVSTLREIDFPVWSRSVHAQGTVKETPGFVNGPIVCAGQRIDPGDVVVADDDGVVIVAREAAAETLEKARARVEKEEASRARFEAGELGLDFYGLRDKLEGLGVVWLDSPDDA
jgi:4-hydroxy-4-methyl-2-oxoglutarate aldolase